MQFVPRLELRDFEWVPDAGKWRRPEIDRATLDRLSERSTLNGLGRIAIYLALLLGSAAATLVVARVNLWLAIVPLYVYYFLYGFWVAIAHEMQHKIIFARNADWLNEALWYVVQTLLWNSPRYSRISHRLHHRYTMVRGMDPETDWPEVVTSRWLRRHFRGRILAILMVGAVTDLYGAVKLQVQRVAGARDRMMRDYCSDKDIRIIRIESAAILLVHLLVVALAVATRRWEPVLMVTIAWQVGWAIEGLWHQTEHIGRCYNVNDQRLCTRSIRVGPLIKRIYFGLDDHVDHHMFPAVPSRNLPKLHALLKDKLATPLGVVGNWREMFAIAREKDRHPDHEFVPCAID